MLNKKLDKLRDKAAGEMCVHAPISVAVIAADRLVEHSDHMREAHLPLVECLKDFINAEDEDGEDLDPVAIIHDATKALMDTGYINPDNSQPT